MLRPVRPCVPVSAGMGCARSPLQSGRASWTVLCRSPERNASTRDCPACCCACRRRTAPFPRHCWRLLRALPFVVRGDITHQVVDALFVAANSKLRGDGGGGGGGGVDGAVHAAASPWLLQASLALAPCPPGGAVLTEAFDLAPVRWVIHAVGPIYQGPQDAATLTSAYTQALARADEVGATSVAFPPSPPARTATHWRRQRQCPCRRCAER